MSLDQIKNLSAITVVIPRYTDQVVIEKLAKIVEDGRYSVQKFRFQFAFSSQTVEVSDWQADPALRQILELNTVATFSVSIWLGGEQHLEVERTRQQNVLSGNQDVVKVHPPASGSPTKPSDFVKLLALARKHFEPMDTKPFIDLLDDSTKQVYQSREQDLQRLERMQEDFFQSMTKFTLDQQQQQHAFQRQLESDYAARQTNLEKQHQERLKQFEIKEAELKKIRADIDERENRQARRDIYKELKAKIEARNKNFELTEGTRKRRRPTFWFSLGLLTVLAVIFGYCFYQNVIRDVHEIHWIAVGSQVGSAIALIGVATFFIRWNNQWFQKHADEEFKLKRLDLDIDRANWLVELALEWKNITKSEIPSELIDKLARSLFTSEDSQSTDIHPVETLLAGLLGKAGSINFELPGKVSMKRSEHGEGKQKDDSM